MEKVKGFSLDSVSVLPSIFEDRFKLNRKYVMSLKNKNLLQNYYFEAGLNEFRDKPEDLHWGWESPTCQLRGHFLGHWLSAAARIYKVKGDMEVKAKADHIVAELARCQQENGGEWAGPIPEKYLDWIAEGKKVWAPQYTLHKTLMGLVEMYTLANNEQALEILINWADWFYRWTDKFTREELDDILDVETGGMLEVWADLYGITGSEKHLELLRRYDRPRLFEPLLAGKDVLTNMHANTTIPEVLGAARAYEVTGEKRWLDIVKAYWEQAVTKRGYYCTGGQTSGEIWTPPEELSARLGDKNQEHCTVYNMMRLADFLFRQTGDVTYADYWERNLYNGILAQQHPETGMITYFLPLQAGAQKKWGTPTEDFWCCHGSLVQAHPMYGSAAYYQDQEGLVVTQYIPSELELDNNGNKIVIKQEFNKQVGSMQAVNGINIGIPHRPQSLIVKFSVNCENSAEFTIKFRLPWWLQGEAELTVNGEQVEIDSKPSSFCSITRKWSSDDKVSVKLPKGLTSCPLPDMPEMTAFMDGPVVLAGICNEERTLYGDKENPETILTPDNEREWVFWLSGYRTINQERGFRFIPLYEVVDEKYTVYFPVKES